MVQKKKSSSSPKKTARTSRTKKAGRKKKTAAGSSVPRFLLLIVVLMAISFVAGYWLRSTITGPGDTSKTSKSFSRTARKKDHSPPEQSPAKSLAYAPGKPIEKPPAPEVPKTLPEVPLKKICLILDDFGYSFSDEMQSVLDLDSNINVAILPGRRFSHTVMKYASHNGNEVIIHAPFEAKEGSTEPYYIRKGDGRREVHDLLGSWFSGLPEAVGMNNHQGSLATADAVTMKYVMSFLKQKRKLFVDSLTTPDSQGYSQARAAGVPAAKRTVAFLDNHDEHDLIMKYIRQWLRQSNENYISVAIGHITKHHTRKILMELIPQLKEKGYRLVPISQVVKTAS